MRRFCLTLCALLAVAPQPVAAQYAADLAVGARVRAKQNEKTVKSTFVRLSRDSLYLRDCADCAAIALSNASVERLEVSRGRRSIGFSGIVYGGLLGAAIGGVVGHERGQRRESDICAYQLCKYDTVEATVQGVGLGLLIGAALGPLIRLERWDRVW